MSIQGVRTIVSVIAGDVGGIIQKTLQRLMPNAEVTDTQSAGDDLCFNAKFRRALTLHDVSVLVKNLRSSLGANFTVAVSLNHMDPSCVGITLEHNMLSKLTKKQEQLDGNEDGKIDETDLKKLREGKKPGDEKEEARIKGDEAYDWFTFTGKSIEAENDRGRTLRLSKGEKFGARKSSNGKQIRLVTEKDGVNKVFTCDMGLATYLGKNCKAE